MSRHRAAVFQLSFVALCCVSACRSDGAQQVAGAVESFIDFGMSNEERPAPGPRGPSLGGDDRPNERSRKLNTKARGGPQLYVELDLDHKLSAKAVEETLARQLDRLLTDGSYAKIRIKGLPAGLLRYGGQMGTATARRKKNGEVARTIKSTINEKIPPLTNDEHRALVALELAEASSRSKAKARRRIDEDYGAELVREAIKKARRRYR